MCDIAGVVGINEREVALRAVERMARALVRRNRSWNLEQRGFWSQAFGDFDLSDAGLQPMRCLPRATKQRRRIGRRIGVGIFSFSNCGCAVNATTKR